MPLQYVLSDYVAEAMAEAIYDKLEDETFAGKIPSCPGVIAFGTSLRQCEQELRSTLEDWILVGLRLGRPLPVLASIDLNKEPSRERLDVERNHEPVCRIEPVKGRKPVTAGEFEKWWKSLPRPDDKFADDLKEIHNMFKVRQCVSGERPK
jgi:predicted RNase H-like HicB family nuclease